MNTQREKSSVQAFSRNVPHFTLYFDGLLDVNKILLLLLLVLFVNFLVTTYRWHSTFFLMENHVEFSPSVLQNHLIYWLHSMYSWTSSWLTCAHERQRIIALVWDMFHFCGKLWCVIGATTQLFQPFLCSHMWVWLPILSTIDIAWHYLKLLFIHPIH